MDGWVYFFPERSPVFPGGRVGTEDVTHSLYTGPQETLCPAENVLGVSRKSQRGLHVPEPWEGLVWVQCSQLGLLGTAAPVAGSVQPGPAQTLWLKTQPQAWQAESSASTSHGEHWPLPLRKRVVRATVL